MGHCAQTMQGAMNMHAHMVLTFYRRAIHSSAHVSAGMSGHSPAQWPTVSRKMRVGSAWRAFAVTRTRVEAVWRHCYGDGYTWMEHGRGQGGTQDI